MKYERLTERNEGDVTINCKQCEYHEKLMICTDYSCIDSLKNRLAELEDKIERGELVDVKENHLIPVSRANGKSSKQLETIDILTKYENGTLVELPCKVGDTLYYVNMYTPIPRIEENKVHTIEMFECMTGLTIRIWTQNGTFYADKMPNVFKTKAEAEKKLKELEK